MTPGPEPVLSTTALYRYAPGWWCVHALAPTPGDLVEYLRPSRHHLSLVVVRRVRDGALCSANSRALREVWPRAEAP